MGAEAEGGVGGSLREGIGVKRVRKGAGGCGI